MMKLLRTRRGEEDLECVISVEIPVFSWFLWRELGVRSVLQKKRTGSLAYSLLTHATRFKCHGSFEEIGSREVLKVNFMGSFKLV